MRSIRLLLLYHVFIAHANSVLDAFEVDRRHILVTTAHAFKLAKCALAFRLLDELPDVALQFLQTLSLATITLIAGQQFLAFDESHAALLIWQATTLHFHFVGFEEALEVRPSMLHVQRVPHLVHDFTWVVVGAWTVEGATARNL